MFAAIQPTVAAVFRLPKIGAGLAGGDWPTIEAIIGEEPTATDVTIVEYQA